jgi:hypothetical protein
MELQPLFCLVQGSCAVRLLQGIALQVRKLHHIFVYLDRNWVNQGKCHALLKNVYVAV